MNSIEFNGGLDGEDGVEDHIPHFAFERVKQVNSRLRRHTRHAKPKFEVLVMVG